METQGSAFWQHDYAAMLERAKDERKFVLLEYSTPVEGDAKRWIP
jgi:hypothetical protein